MGVKKKRIRVFCDIVTFSAGDKNFYFFAAPQNILSLHFFLTSMRQLQDQQTAVYSEEDPTCVLLGVEHCA